MANDQFGNYIANIEPPVAPYPPSGRCCRSGVGAPLDVDGNNGQTYIDLSNGDLYVKASDVWALVDGGGGGGAIEVYEGRDPLPPDDPAKGALSYPDGGGTLTQWNVDSQAWV